jgi:hypothetical protein
MIRFILTLRADKRGHIAAQLPPILQRLNIDAKQWLNASEHFERDFYYAIGPVSKLNEFCKKLDKYWLHGKTACNALYATPTPWGISYESSSIGRQAKFSRAGETP